MTVDTAHVRIRNGAPLVIAGWSCIVLFAAVALVTNGLSAWAFSGVIAAIAVAMIAWYRSSDGRAAVLTGLVLGLLITLAMSLGVADDLKLDEPLKRTLNDVFAVAAGLMIVVGSVVGMRRR